MLIPKELKLPPVTEADLEELARDIESLGYIQEKASTSEHSRIHADKNEG